MSNQFWVGATSDVEETRAFNQLLIAATFFQIPPDDSFHDLVVALAI